MRSVSAFGRSYYKISYSGDFSGRKPVAFPLEAKEVVLILLHVVSSACGIPRFIGFRIRAPHALIWVRVRPYRLTNNIGTVIIWAAISRQVLMMTQSKSSVSTKPCGGLYYLDLSASTVNRFSQYWTK